MLPWWAIALIVVRDIAILIGGAFLLTAANGPPPVTKLGKFATFVLMSALPMMIASVALGTISTPQPAVRLVGWVTFAVGVALYWAAAIDYVRILRRQPQSGDV